MALLWAGFIFVVVIMLIIDLGFFHKEPKEVSVKDALAWTVVWVTLGLLFSIFVFYGYENKWLGLGESVDAVDGLVNGGWAATLKYLTGYVVEKSLSLDNIFVIAMIFGYFSVPKIYQHRVLFWGILGALVMRGIMIYFGAKLISEFHWILYIFGLFLILTAIKMLLIKTESDESEKTFIVRLARRFLPITEKFHGEHFIVKAGSKESLCGAIPGETALPDKVVANAKPGKLYLGNHFNFYLLGGILLILASGVIISLLAGQKGQQIQSNN